MRRIVGIALAVVATAVLCAPVSGAPEGSGSGVVPGQPAPRIINDDTPVPAPVDPLPVAAGFGSNEFQLVGFTSRFFYGNAGVLSMSIGCRQEFPGSRMCTFEEVSKSVYIPASPGQGYAWVQNLAEPGTFCDLNCRGWMSVSPDDQGTSIELGEFYGGMVMQGCNARLAVACCALFAR